MNRYQLRHGVAEKNAYIQKGEEMTILAVSNNKSLLENLCNGLSSILPNAKAHRGAEYWRMGIHRAN